MPLQTAERLALQHQRDLATIAGATTSVVASVAMGADPATISTWYFGVVDGLLARIQAGHAQARLSSTQFLAKHAAMNGVDLTPVPASLNMERARTSLRVTGPVAFQTAMRAGQDEEQAIRSMATQMAGSSQRLVMAGDRDTFEQTLNADKGVIGWRRRLAGRSCGFCAMLASRGAVYETRKSATQAKDGLAFHDHCNCWAEPMYKHETEPPEVRLLQRQWRNVTAGKRGGGAARAWRQHWEENVSPVERERLGMAAAKAAPSPIPGPPTPTPGVVVRTVLDDKKTLGGLEQAWTAEARRITGRDLDVVIPPGTSLQTAKEYAEGVLRGMERFPDSALQRIRFGQMAQDHYAEAGQRSIVFNDRWANIPNRPGLVRGEARAVDGWSTGAGWGVRGDGTTMSTAIHEFGHIIDIDTLGQRIHPRAVAIVKRHAAAEGISDAELVARDISEYATADRNELIAEAFADVMLRGEAASPVAREIFDLLEAEYFRAGGRITPSFGTFPAKAAPVRALTPAEFDARIKAATSGSEVDRKVPLDRNSDVVVKSAAARKALDSMGGTGFEEINGMLRGGRVSDAVRRRREAQVSTVDSLMEQSPISSDVELWRGSATGRGVFGDRLSGDLTGFEWTESGYVSTSWRRDTAELFATTNESAPGVLVRMLTPGGTHAVRLLGGEGELVLERGLRMRVVRDQGIVTITPREGVAIGRIDRPHQVRMLDVEVVRAAPVPVAAAEVPLAKMTVADLRALAKERGVTLPPKALKADIVRALEEGPSAPPAGGGFVRAVTTADDFDRRAADAISGRRVENSPPIRVQVDASSGSDVGKWKATEATGVSGSPRALLSAVTSRVRVSGLANPRLRLPEGRPLADWEVRLRAGYTPEMRARLEAMDLERRAKEIAAGDREIAALDRAMADSKLPSDVILWRGADVKDIGLPAGDLAGFEWTDLGFVGTSATRQVSESFLAGDPVLMRILAPEGTPAIGIAGGGEAEVLLGRGLGFRVVRESRTPSGTRLLDVEIVPARKAVVPTAAAPNLSKLKVADLRTMAAERQIPIPAKATKAELVRLVQSTPDEIKALQQKAIREAAFARAKTGAEALRAAPVGLSHDAAQEPILSGLSKLSRAERDHIEHSVNLYATGSGAQLNDFLRAGRTMGDAESDALIGPFVRDIETALEHSPLRSDVLVWRGVDREILGDATRRDDLTGFEWIDPTFVSTSAVRREAEGFGNVLLRMVAPKGTPALRISDLAGEAELLLGPGSRFRVIRDLGMQDRSRPGSQMRVLDVEVIPHVVTDAERKAMAQRAIRDAARERNRLIESSTGTARLLAEVDELVSKGASKATILQRLDPKLIAPEQVFAGADAEIVKALRAALETGDTAKLRTALTRAGTKAKVKPISKAGAKVKFDPATMEAVAGEIADGAQVVVVTRGSTLTLPDGSTMQLTKAKVTAVAKPLLKPLTRRELAIIEAKRKIPSLQAELRALPAGDPRRANVQYLLDNERAVIDQKPGPGNYNWSSPYWESPAGSRVLRPPTAPELAKHIDNVVSPVIPSGTRTDLTRELERQAELTPRSMLHFRGINDPANFDFVNNGNSYAYYETLARRVSIKPDWIHLRADLERSYAGDISTGWHPPTGGGMLEAVTAHEYGHHVTYRLIEAPLVDQRRLIKLLDDTFALNGHLVREFRRDPDLKKVVTDFVSGPYGVGRVNRAVSKYAQKNYQEFFAEIWSEYTTMGDKARPQVKAIGDMMRRMAELSDVVLTP